MLSNLARRPIHLSAAQQMEVQVGYALPGTLSLIDHYAESVLHNRFFLRQFLDRQHNAPHQTCILFAQRHDPRNVPLRYDKDVDRRDGIQILERYDVLILLHDLGCDLVPGYSAEYAPFHCRIPS